MVNENQKLVLNEILILFNELELVDHVILVGSWVEYFYVGLFENEFHPEIATRDVDFFYRNIKIPDKKIPLISKLKESGFVYDESLLSGISRFYKKGIIEIEFLTKVIRPTKDFYFIKSIGITAEALRELDLLSKYCVKLKRDNYEVVVPQPSAYVIHKILINEKRRTKKLKDLRSINNLLFSIKSNSEQLYIFNLIIANLTKKEKRIFDFICTKNHIDLSGIIDFKI